MKGAISKETVQGSFPQGYNCYFSKAQPLSTVYATLETNVCSLQHVYEPSDDFYKYVWDLIMEQKDPTF